MFGSFSMVAASAAVLLFFSGAGCSCSLFSVSLFGFPLNPMLKRRYVIEPHRTHFSCRLCTVHLWEIPLSVCAFVRRAYRGGRFFWSFFVTDPRLYRLFEKHSAGVALGQSVCLTCLG